MGRTEDQIRNSAETILGFVSDEEAISGTGQITTFNQLGFKGVNYKPDGWYLPKDKEPWPSSWRPSRRTLIWTRRNGLTS